MDSTAEARSLQRSVKDCVLLYSSPALNLLKNDAGSESTRIMTAASIATVCLVCTACVIRLLTVENRTFPIAALIIKNIRPYNIGICPLLRTFP